MTQSDAIPFDSIYRHGYVRVAAAVPQVRIADPAYNAQRTEALARQAHDRNAALVTFPELGLAAYTSEDLFKQDALLHETLQAIEQLRAASVDLQPLIVVGAPLRHEQGLFNAAVVFHRGRILGVAPKSYLPEYREFYEKRQFRAARDAISDTIAVNGATVPFGNRLLFTATDIPNFTFTTEICEDLWTAIPPSTFSALAGATVIANLSASNVTVGKSDYRHLLIRAHSARTLSAYIYTASGIGESTTDLAWDGHAMIAENGEELAGSIRFAGGEQLITADIDLDRLVNERTALSSWGDAIHDFRRRLQHARQIPFRLDPDPAPTPLQREIERFPYVPSNPATRNARCEEVYTIQVTGLQTRLQATGMERLVIGISGGLDSTHALIVAAKVMDRLGLPRTNILAYTMPGFGTSRVTLDSARGLMAALGVSAAEIDIRAASQAMLDAIGHPGPPHYDTTYENVQAGERTSHLFRLANMHDALVVGTGDLSELALGWCTYGVGDQMSHYNVNASVPKTLIQFLLRWVIDSGQFGPDAGAVLQTVLDTEISPELIPADHDPAGEGPPSTVVPDPANLPGPPSTVIQSSEATVGPYELQDFFLYHVLRFGNRPSKVAWLAEHAWGDRDRGRWPDLIPAGKRNEYSIETIEHWLEKFLSRFFTTSQFKRSAIPNAPKVGSGGSLSPRGDWRAPSDGNSAVWLRELGDGLADAGVAGPRHDSDTGGERDE